MASRLKAIFVLAAPFLLSALILVILTYTERHLSEVQADRIRQEWDRLARQGLHRLRASQTIESQLEMMGARLESIIVESAKRSRPESLFDTRVAETAFTRAYPPLHRPAGTLLVSFGVASDGRFIPFPHKTLPRMKGKLLADLMDFYRETSESGIVDPKRQKAVSSKNSLIFGPWSPPRLIAGREGRITPVRYEETDGMMTWRTINYGKNVIGGVMIVWPHRMPKATFPLRYALERAARLSDRRYYPLLAPVSGVGHSLKPLLPHATRRFARTHPRSFRRLVDSIPRMKRGKTLISGDFLVFREYFSTEYPYDMVAIAPVPKIRTQAAGLLTGYRSLFICFWGFVFGYICISGRPPPVSLRTMFRTLFLLVASLPLGMLVTFGYLQISSETQRAIDAVETSAVDTLNSLDIQSRQSLPKFAQCAQKVFSSPAFIRNILGTPSDEGAGPSGHSTADPAAQAASDGFATFRASGEPLENLLIFRPGKKSRAFSRGGIESSSDETLDFFAGIINLTHNSLISGLGTLSHSEIMLDTENQKNWRTIFESFGILAFNSLFYNLMEYGQMSSAGSEDISLHVSQVFFDAGRPSAYVLFHSSTRTTQKNFLVRELSRLNLRHPARHACGTVTPGGATAEYPSPDSGYWNTSDGKMLQECMDHSAISDTPVILRRGNLLAVAAPCRTLGPMVTGSIFQLDGLFEADARSKRLLLLFALTLGIIAFILGRLTADYLVTPLEAVERTLRIVSTGDLAGRVGMARADEIGRMTASFDAMIAGLRERRELGKFVSGAIDSALAARGIEKPLAQSVRGTVLVSDIRSFTTMSESHPPADIVALLNTHMEAMTAAIARHGGQIDRFIGDAVVAVFLTTDQNSGASPAVAAAIEMNEATRAINRQRAEAGAFTYGIGIGIASGDLMAGTLDGARRRDFIVIGEPRSRAEVLENRSKTGRHTRIILDRTTAALVDTEYLFEELPDEGAAELVEARRTGA
ncbi:MAG TPA: adenylate/guanylate cyclase domain-containing protein [Candidatus Ozemobacteraceae bacterium]|nr:adenylate/guanylate cyclase domain-containing protein [Candidatus Ozemobacteraceae bacterium]